MITTMQTTYILSSTIIGFSIITVPRRLAEEVGTPDVWISIILGWIISLLIGLLITNFALRYQGKTFFDFSKQLAGKGIGTILCIIFIFYALLISGFEIRMMGEVTKFYLLENTPIEVILISMLWVGSYAAMGGINLIARLIQLLAPITFIIFFIVIIMGLKMFQTENILPVLGHGVIPVVKGIPPTLFTISGVEFIMIWIAFMKHPKKAKKAVFWGTAIPTALNLTATILTIGALSINGARADTYPLISFVKQYEYVGIFFERFESFLLIVWIIQIFFTYVLTHYTASLGLSQLFGKKLKPFVLLFLPIIYLIALFPRNLIDVFALETYAGYYGLIIMGVFIAIFFIGSKIKLKKKR
ncbi:GerAB/ArcD/ProY family transporter [Bacillus sp. FJAT-53060]|uniref:GerAB/ArcD/ProY family transporter n=1 Tax=Bacillus sp. FJAT-53060 TaxID=3127666 RepID=UPI003013B76D